MIGLFLFLVFVAVVSFSLSFLLPFLLLGSTIGRPKIGNGD